MGDLLWVGLRLGSLPTETFAVIVGGLLAGMGAVVCALWRSR